MRPSLGVLVTYYNERELVRKCLESLISQPEPPDEILVYDDASSFPARDYIPAEWPVRILRAEKNRGPSHGRNTLLSASTSDYIHFHDSDDWFHPEWCRKVRAKLNPEEVDAVFTEVGSFDGKLHRDRVVGIARLIGGEELVRFCLIHAMLVPAGTYRRRLVDKLGGYRTELWQSEDFEFHCRLAAYGIRYALIDESLVHISIRPESRSQTDQKQVWNCRLSAIRLLFLDLPPKYYPTIAEAALEVGSKLFQMGARVEARKAFQLAREIGPPSYSQQMAAYRRVARVLGPEAAEWFGLVYRHLLPGPLRGWVRRKAG